MLAALTIASLMLKLRSISVNTLLMMLGSPPSIANESASSYCRDSRRNGIFFTIDFSFDIRKFARCFRFFDSAIFASFVKSMFNLILLGN